MLIVKYDWFRGSYLRGEFVCSVMYVFGFVQNLAKREEIVEKKI